MSVSDHTAHVAKPRFFRFAIPFLGILGAIQGSAPNISSTALASVSRSLDMDGGTVALAASIQTIAIAATVITTGLLADRIGRRKVLYFALILGIAGSVVSALAPTSSIYLLGQALVGVGLGAVYAAAFAYIHAVTGKGKLAASLGVFGATVGLVALIFTFLGSSLVGIDWRLGFAVTAVAGLIGLLLVPNILPPEPKVAGNSIDAVGQLLLGVGIIGFLYGVSQTGKSLTAPGTLIPLIAGIVLLTGFFIWESRTKEPFYPVHIFKSPIFIAAILAGFIYNYGTAVAFLQSTNLWQYVTGVSTRSLALWQVPMILATVIAALVMGRLMGKGLPNRIAILIGGVLTALGFAGLALVSDQKDFLAFLPGLIGVGLGLGGMSVPFGSLIIQEAPPAHYGTVTSSRTTIGQFFYSIGFALATVLVDKLTIGGVVNKLTDSGVQPDMVGTAVTSINQYVKTGDDPSTALAREALADATASYSQAFSTVMLVSAVLLLVAGVVAFLLLTRADHKGISHSQSLTKKEKA